MLHQTDVTEYIYLQFRNGGGSAPRTEEKYILSSNAYVDVNEGWIQPLHILHSLLTKMQPPPFDGTSPEAGP